MGKESNVDAGVECVAFAIELAASMPSEQIKLSGDEAFELTGSQKRVKGHTHPL